MYIHGGGFTGGCGHEKQFDGPVWPTKGVIAVTLNYRLGPLGFACLPELKDEAGYTGNYGLYDQMTALKWIRDNIAAFGGDPAAVTIMGQSAGAMSVQQHCLSPMTDGLFSKAVMSSGGGVNKMLSTGKPDACYDFWYAVMEQAGCKTLEDFRDLDVADLFSAWKLLKKKRKGGGCFPCVDGQFIVDSASDLVAQGKQKDIPYMAGSTSHDMMPPFIFSMARDWCAGQGKASYAWFFDRRLPGDDNGAWHSSDLWYWFGTLKNCWRPMERKDYQLSNQMTDYLCNFVKTGNPNGDNLPVWQPAGKKQPKVLRLGEGGPRMGKPSMAKLWLTALTNKSVGE